VFWPRLDPCSLAGGDECKRRRSTRNGGSRGGAINGDFALCHEYLDTTRSHLHRERRADCANFHPHRVDNERFGRVLLHGEMGLAVQERYAPLGPREIDFDARAVAQFGEGSIW
jgi:hypothetical protein